MLEIKNLNKSYGKNIIFKDLNLTLNNNEVISIVGPSGIGKTTLLKIIIGLENADSGLMILDGKNIDPTVKHRDGKIGVVFQDYNLFPHMTVLENVTLALIKVKKYNKEQADKIAMDWLVKLNLEQRAKSYPLQLSGGQKQRVALARALAMGPEVLAYDEPTAALDSDSTKQVAKIIGDLKLQGVSQLVITHDRNFANEISDRIFDFQTDVKR